MNLTSWLGRLLGYDDVAQIDAWQASFGAGWAHQNPWLVVLGMLAALAAAGWFYVRLQPRTSVRARWLLAGLRGSVLACLLLILADPILEVTLVRHPRPSLWLVFDGSQSLSLADDWPSARQQELEAAVDWRSFAATRADASAAPTRDEFVRAFLHKQQGGWLAKLAERFQFKAFAISTRDGTQPLTIDESALTKSLNDSWKLTGEVTALGDAFEDLARRQAGDNLAGLVVISDFDQNAGTAPLSAAQRLGAPIFTVGLGPETAVDLSVDLLTPPTLKKAETSTIVATVRQRELEQSAVTVRVFAESSPDAAGQRQRLPIGERSLTLTTPAQALEFPYTPDQTGRFTFVAEVDPIEGETVTQNNRSEREARIIDDFLRLLYVEYEPTWEWRFVKEVFHRDKLVGLRGFRTFLRSADPVVRETNELFVSSLTLPRSEFFEADVVFLGDLPASTLSTRFCEMTAEFVGQFGGGLVVMAGPRFGPGELAETPLAELLPVVVNPDGRRRDDKEFRLQPTALATQFDFMRLGKSEQDPLYGWSNLGKLPWYQPVLRVDPRATVLAEHPTDQSADGRTKQPLIAIRPYGRGEVVYLAFNELWRLRRLYGEEYYRQFWGQLIHRLGLSHALGSQKRFVMRTDRPSYRSGDEVVVTVEAYDEDFQPLQEADVSDRRLPAELIRPEPDAQGQRSTELTIPALRPGVFETRLTVLADGEHRLRVTDPVTQTPTEISFTVADASAERRNPVRNAALQQSLAAETGGKSYDLTELHRFLDDFHPPNPRETTVDIFPLWSTWLTFCLILAALLLEWSVRKLVNLT